MKTIHDIRKFENFHIFLWLMKDMCWVTLSKVLGMIMIFPTLALAIYITFKNRHDKAELMHNIAICCWISANSVWMIGEFYFNDNTRQFAVVFFISGMVAMLNYYIPGITRKYLLRKTGK